MKVFLIASLLVFTSCKTGEIKNIWDSLTPAQKTLVYGMAEATCLKENANAFTKVYDRVINVSENLATTETVIVDYQIENWARAATEYSDPVETVGKIKFDVSAATATSGIFVGKVTSSADAYQINYDSASTDLATYWTEVKTRICNSAAANAAYSKVSVSTNAIIYKYFYSDGTQDIDSNGTKDTVETSITYTIDPDYPLFFEYFNKTQEIVTIYDNGEIQKEKKTWSLAKSTSRHNTAQNDAVTCPNSPNSIDNDTDYGTCFKSGMAVGF